MSMKRIGMLVGLTLVLTSVACGATPAPLPPPPSATPAPQQLATSTAPTEATATSLLPSPTAEEPLAARVNGEPIYLADYELEVDRYRSSLEAQGTDPNSQEGQEKLDQARDWILNVMIEQKLTEQAAAEAGVEVTDADIDAYMQSMIDESGGEEAFRERLEAWGETYEHARREVRAQLIGTEMTQRIVAQVPESAEQVHARHILVDTEEEANHLHSQLEAGADFSELAKAHSQDKSTQQTGGDLGYFPRGILLAPDVEEAAFSLQPGQISPVISSPLGFHIVQVVERDPNRAIGAENLQLLREQAVQTWVESLWAKATVERLVGTGS